LCGFIRYSVEGEKTATLLRFKSTETLLQNFKDLNLNILFSGLKAWHIMEQKRPFCITDNSGNDFP